MAAATFMPTVEVPPASEGNKPRLFELRTYESHSLRARRMKLQMFGELGELAIFRRTGLRPVFFGDNVVGDRLPSFTYMLTFDDMAAREKNWGAFIADSEWQTLRAKPGYTDPEIVSNITSIILRPTGYSQNLKTKGPISHQPPASGSRLRLLAPAAASTPDSRSGSGLTPDQGSGSVSTAGRCRRMPEWERRRDRRRPQNADGRLAPCQSLPAAPGRIVRTTSRASRRGRRSSRGSTRPPLVGSHQ